MPEIEAEGDDLLEHLRWSVGEASECVRSASCEVGDHTYSWPCIYAVYLPAGGGE